MDHGPATRQQFDDPVTAARNARTGAILFMLYLSLYAAFVGINAFAPQAMDQVIFAGINLAILYGLGLIVAAVGLALVYGWLCRVPARAPAVGGPGAPDRRGLPEDRR